MAQYWEDWSGSTIGSAPTGWSVLFGGTITYTVEDETDPLAPAGRRLRIRVGSTQGRRFIGMDAAASDPDRATYEIALLVKVATMVDAAFGLGAMGRAAGTGGAEIGVNAGFNRGTGTETVDCYRGASYKNGTSAFFGTPDKTGIWTAGNVYWLRVKVVGSDVTLTLADGDDPDTILKTWTGTESQGVNGAGALGIFTFQKSRTWDVYAVGIGTGADLAPTSDLGSATHALAGAATVSASASADLTTAGASPVKGVSLTLHDGQTPKASVTGISAVWWDTTDPTDATPVFTTAAAATDENGVLTIDLDAETALTIGQSGFLLLHKAGATPTDDLEFSGRLAVQDIA